MFIALPIVLYGQFESADTQRRELVSRGIQQRSWLIAQALTPLLDRPDGLPHKAMNQMLARFNDGRTFLKLMFRPAGTAAGGSFYYIASAPEVAANGVGAELQSLAEHGVLRQLADSCEWNTPLDLRYRQPDGHEEILTAVLPIQSRWGCWVLVSSHPATEFLNISIGRSYWQTREVRIAAAIYLAFALLATLVAVSVWRSLHHFRRVAREIRQGRGRARPFANRAVVPELTSVAVDFDYLVRDLRRVAHDIRQTAEDNAHSFKGPISTIQSAMEPIRNMVAAENPRGQRAIRLVDASVRRLYAMVNAAQRLDHDTADMIDAPRMAVNVTDVVGDILYRYRETLGDRNIRLIRVLEENALVWSGAGVIDIAFENILSNAISFSPAGSGISVYLFRDNGWVHLHVDDEGPGIAQEKLEHVFDRYFSLRPRRDRESGEGAAHAGLGLWIVRRNVEALGGSIEAINRISGGLSMRIKLPLAG
ncbi:sensor histidine kinase [Ferrovibrio xuzhouensis]|uniref:histidine kinase n=1 Tax=Ferrovibrio xuzhouensis TaxID=1576914 RepID=A0ABV7V9X1_9PROT